MLAEGIDPERIQQLLNRVERDVTKGLLPAAQLALARNGRLIVAKSYGSASNDSLICLFSATKGVVYAAAWLLFQAGQLQEDDVVADIIPEFAGNGKERVTVQQLFTHTSGFPHAPFSPLQWNSKQKTLERFAQWRLNWAPGSRYEYHPTSSMWVIAEIIERRTQMRFTDFIRERVLDPLGLCSIFVGLPDTENRRVLPIENFGNALAPDDGRVAGTPALQVSEITDEILLAYNRPEVRSVGVPGAGGFANATDLALFYQALLLGGLNGVELWKEETRIGARRVRTGDLSDPAVNASANRGLGIIVSGGRGRLARGFGEANSPVSFGHNGAGGQLAWADPVSGISLAYLTSGHDRNYHNQMKRGAEIGHLAAQCALRGPVSTR